MRAGWGALACVLASGCIDGVPVVLPPPGPEIATRVVVVRDGTEEAVWVLVPGEAEALPSSLALGEGAGVYLFDYTDSAELLGLSPGPRIDDPDNTRVLPSTGGFTGRLSGGEVSWSEDADLAILATVRWPDLDWNACLRRGGCGERARSDAPLLCSATCLASDVVPPQAPTPPRFEGWGARGVGHGLEFPSPPSPDVSCPAPTALWYGADTCEPVAECGGPWPEEPDGPGEVWYVAEGGVGTGRSAEDALGSLSTALQLAAPGDTILLSGAHVAPAVWTAPTKVIGACPDRARLTAPAETERVELAAPGLRLIGLTLPHITVSASVSLSRVQVGGGPGPAVQVEATGELSANRVLVDSNDAQGILLTAGSLRLRDAVIRGALSRGIDATGGRLELHDTRIIETRSGGAGASDAGVVCVDCTLTGAGLETVNNAGAGLLMVGGAARGFKYFLHRGSNTRWPGAGLQAQGGAEVDMEFVYASGPSTFGVLGFESSRLDLRDIAVEGIGDSAEGLGAMTFDGVRAVHLARVFVLESRLPALLINAPQEDTTTVEDLIVVSEGDRDDNEMLSLLRANVELDRVSVYAAGMPMLCTHLVAPANIRINDLHAEVGTVGIDLEGGSTIHLHRAEILGTTGFGLRVGSISFNDDFSLAMGTDIVIRPRGGVSAIAGVNGALELERFAMEGPATHGVQSVANGEVVLHDGTLRDLEVGVSIQDTPDYDITKLVEGVRYVGVARPLSLAQ